MRTNEVLPGIWHIEESYRDHCTLVCGTDRAILWDTGQGRGDLSAFAASQTTRPLTVCLSHGHDDHTGGRAAFERVLIDPADRWMLAAQDARTGGAARQEIGELLPGQRFDLGCRHATVVDLAGHTRGSVGLLLEEDRLLLAGDALGPTLLMLGAECAPLDVLRRTLERTLALPFDRFLASHSPRPLPKELAAVHLRHLDHLHTEPPSHPGPYGPDLRRSEHKEHGLRSVLYLHRSLLP